MYAPQGYSRHVVELSIVMPCLNEAETIASCIRQARQFLETHSVEGEIIVADNGSTDGSQQIAAEEGATVVHVPERGYGAALQAGIETASGTFVAMGDADDSYDFGALLPFLAKLRDGCELVMGNRFAGGIAPGAMPFHHRYLGNPALSFIGRILFKTDIRDFHCGLRAFRRQAILDLELRTTGMEFASEMVVRAVLAGLSVSEVPTPLRVDGRSRPPHLRSFRDGWRHLRFLFLYSPRWLLMYPGIFLILVGAVASVFLSIGSVSIANIRFDIATLLYAHASIIIGFQAFLLAMLSRVYATQSGFLPPSMRTTWAERFLSPARATTFGAVIAAIGIVASFVSLNYWRSRGFGDLSPTTSIRVVAPGVLGLILGSQLTLGGVFSSILRIPTK